MIVRVCRAFPRLLAAASQAYHTNKSEIDRVTRQLSEQMGRTGQMPRGFTPADHRGHALAPTPNLPLSSTI